jgi:hypothetical protein
LDEQRKENGLPRDLQLAAQRQMQRMYRLNPLGNVLLVGQVVFLLALHYGAGDLAMGLLYAGVWLAGITAFVTPALCARKDPARLAAESWMVRSLVCLGYLTLPFLPDALKVPALVTVFLTFMVIRTIGVSALNVATAAYAGPGELSAVVASSHLWWHIGTLAITVVSTAVLSVWSGETAYLALLALGIVLAVASAATMRGLPTVGRRTMEQLRIALPQVLRNRGVRGALAATVLVVPQAVAAAYQLNVLTGPLHVPAERVVALTLCGTVLAIVATRLLGLLLPRTGLRPVQLAAHAALSLLGIAWATSGFLPESWRTPCCIGLYLLAQALLAVSGAILTAIQLDRIPSSAPLATSALYQATGAVASLFGVVLVWAASFIGLDRLPGAGPYAHAFVIWAACSAGVCTLHLATGGVATVLRDLALLSPANVLGMLWAKPGPTDGEPDNDARDT